MTTNTYLKGDTMKTQIIIAIAALTLSAQLAALPQAELSKLTGDYSEAEGLKMLESAPQGTDGNLYRGIILHNLANSGKHEYEQRAENELKTLRNSDPLARAYYGSVLTIKAGSAYKKKDLIGSLILLKRGYGELDKAVSLAPANVTIRFTRLINALESAKDSPIDRMEVAKADIDFLHAQESGLNANDKALLYYWEGEYHIINKTPAKALECFRNSKQSAPQSSMARKAAKRLNEIQD